jgi:hypothetical protein
MGKAELESPKRSDPMSNQNKAAPTSDLPPAAQRALAEAEERRKKAAQEAERPVELGGREGPDPARYGDWEKKGLAIDF